MGEGTEVHRMLRKVERGREEVAASASSVTRESFHFSEDCPNGQKLPQDTHILTRASGSSVPLSRHRPAN